MIVYATVDDLAAWAAGSTIDPACGDSVGALRSASIDVADAIAGDYYATDTGGLPTDTVALQAVKDATCAQALARLSLKISSDVGGVVTTGTLTGVGIGTARKQFADATAAAAARSAVAGGQLVPDALRILRRAGLASTVVWSLG